MPILIFGSSFDVYKWYVKTEYTMFWYQDEDDQGNISQILTGISDLKQQRTHCDGCR